MTIRVSTGNSSEDNENRVLDGLGFILTHLLEPIFPRYIMTKGLGYQKEVFNKKEVLSYFRTSNYEGDPQNSNVIVSSRNADHGRVQQKLLFRHG